MTHAPAPHFPAPDGPVETFADPLVTIDVHANGVVVPCGEIDLANAELLERALDRAGKTAQRLTIDAAGLTFIEVTGVATLLRAARKRDVVVLSPAPPLRRMVRALGTRDDLPGLHLG